MPAERSGQPYFDFQYGEDFPAHIERFDPDFTKVLVRYNPDGDAEANLEQREKLGASATGCTGTTAGSCSSCWSRPRSTSSRRSGATATVTTRSCARS